MLGAAGGWAVVVILQGWSGRALPVPVLAGSALWLLGVAFIIWGSVVGPRLQSRSDPTAHPGVEPLPGLVAARVAAISMAASRVGAFVAGIYTGLGLATIAGGLSTPASTQAVWASLLAASGAAVTCVAAVRLEHRCLLPSGAENDDE